MTPRGSRVLLAFAACVALACAVGLQVARDRGTVSPDGSQGTVPFESTLYVRSPGAMKRLALGFDALAADVYWIRAIQHFGGDRRKAGGAGRYTLLYPLLDLATTLDPYFNIAYRFGSIFLAEPYPGGPGRPDLAIALLMKGIEAQPQKWQYYHDVAFVHYWHFRDYRAASDWFRRAGAQPNAPNWLGPMAAAMLTKAQDRTAARFLWQQILQSEEQWLRRAAERSLQQLDALDAIDQLQAVVRRAPPPTGEQYSWNLLIRRGLLRGIPLDPTRTPFEIDPLTGVVTLSRASPLYPLPKDMVPPGS